MFIISVINHGVEIDHLEYHSDVAVQKTASRESIRYGLGTFVEVWGPVLGEQKLLRVYEKGHPVSLRKYLTDEIRQENSIQEQPLSSM